MSSGWRRVGGLEGQVGTSPSRSRRWHKRAKSIPSPSLPRAPQAIAGCLPAPTGGEQPAYVLTAAWARMSIKLWVENEESGGTPRATR